MKLLLSLIGALTLLISSCKKNTVPTANPQSGFFVSVTPNFIVTDRDTSYTIGTHDVLVLSNKSTNANSIKWSFGDGRTSTDNDAFISYDNPGIYKAKLTTYGENGKTNTSPTLTITVVDRVLKGFSIDRLDINKFAPSQVGLPVFTTLNLWMELKLSRSAFTLTANGDIQAPVIYKSAVFANIDSSFHSSLSFTIPPTEKVLINYPVNNDDYYSGGRGLIISLYGQDASGTYLLSSNPWSMITTWVSKAGNPEWTKTYDVVTDVGGSPTTITLHCGFQ
jgi:PKD repeat protein